MADVRDILPRSVLTPAQQRRLAAVQGARGVLGVPSSSQHMLDILRVARYIENGD